MKACATLSVALAAALGGARPAAAAPTAPEDLPRATVYWEDEDQRDVFVVEGESYRCRVGTIPAAILSALLAPALVLSGEPRTFSLLRPELWVAVPTLLFALKTRSLGGTVVLGMLLFWGAQKLI